MAAITVKTTLKKDKDCKSCVRFRGEQDDKVTTSLYLKNEAYQKIGAKEEIVVEVRAK